jgi:hypothetical protein
MPTNALLERIGKAGTRRSHAGCWRLVVDSSPVDEGSHILAAMGVVSPACTGTSLVGCVGLVVRRPRMLVVELLVCYGSIPCVGVAARRQVLYKHQFNPCIQEQSPLVHHTPLQYTCSNAGTVTL